MEEEASAAIVWEQVRADEVLNRFAITLNGVPFVGGTIAALIQDGLIKKRFARVEGMLSELQARLEELGAAGKVAPGAGTLGNDEEFQEIFLRVMVSAAGEASEGKRRLFKEFLAHTIAEGSHPDIRTHQLLSALELIDLSHLEVLRGLIIEKSLKGKPMREQPWFQGAINVFAGDGGVWDDEITSVFADLQAWGLIHDAGDRTADGKVDWKPTQRGFQLFEYIREDWRGPLSTQDTGA